MNRRVATLVILFGCVLALGLATPVTAGPDDLDGVLDDMEGEGTEEDPYVITNAEELQAMNADLGAHYVLESDIDASETEDWDNGFDPVGEFSGSVDGNGYEINGLHIDRSGEDNVGLFGYVDEGGAVENVGVVNNDITGDSYVGGLVGTNFGSVSESYATGSITGGQYVGGLVGTNSESVTKSYATADVVGDEEVGGLLGQNWGDLDESYATGKVTGDSDVGGLIGIDSGSVSDSYWDTESSDTSESDGGEGLTTDEMTGEDAQDNMNFDWDDTWETTDNYPELHGPPYFEVYGFGQDDFVEDETPTVEGIVENTGEREDTQTVEFAVDGEVHETKEETLEGDSPTPTEFTFPDLDPGEYTYTVTSHDDDYENTVTVLGYEHFEVDITDAPDLVSIDGSGVVTTEIENTGDFDDTQDIEFTFNDTLEDTKTVTLDGGESAEVDFTIPTHETGEFGYTVSSENETATGRIEIYEDGYFEVSVDAPDEIYVDEDATVNATIENLGDVEDTQGVVFTFDNETEATTDVTLDGDESTTVAFEIPGLGEGNFSYSVSSADTDATRTISMVERETGVVPAPPECDGIEVGGACVPEDSALIFGSIVLVLGTLGALVFRG